MADSENSKLKDSLKESIDDSGKAEVEEVDFVEVIELPPEPVTKQDDPEAVEVIQAVEKDIAVSHSLSSDVTVEEKEEILVPGNEQKVEGAVVSSDLPVSDTNNVEASSGVTDSVDKEHDLDSSIPPRDVIIGGGDPEVSEAPRSTENQPSAILTHQKRTSWMNCCGLWDALRRSSQ